MVSWDGGGGSGWWIVGKMINRKETEVAMVAWQH